MTDSAVKEPRKMPKGGRKGGKRFPQYPLNDVVKWADKLVSKTHGGPQPEDLIKASVVEAKSGAGNMRISALKQFALMEGTSQGYAATELAKNLKSSPSEERRPLYERAALNSEIFNAIYETYHGDSVNIAKIRQRAADLQVHPDATSKCADIYVETMEFAGLISKNGDFIVHVEKGSAETLTKNSGDDEEVVIVDDNHETFADKKFQDQNQELSGTRRGVATVQVNINLDSSLDTEKLQKQLELLRRYGAL